MKVLIVMSGPADLQDRGVHARRLPALFDCLRTLGVELHVTLLGDPAGLAEDLTPFVSSVRVLPTHLAPSLAGAAHLPRVLRQLRQQIRELRPDIVEGDEALPAIAAALASPGGRRTSTVTLYRRHHVSGRRRLRAASVVAAHVSERVEVSSHAVRDIAAKLDRLDPSRYLVARSGAMEPRTVPQGEVDTLRTRLQIPPEARVLGVVSRLRHEKGIDVLLSAVDLVDAGPVHVVLVGDGPEEQALRRAAAGVRTTVHFVGHHADVWPWLALSDIVVVPSRREAFGRTTVEAMAAGRPVVASKVGGLVEAVQAGLTGVLVDPDNPKALAAALQALLNHPQTMRAMGANARARYESSHTIESMAESWQAAWLRATQRQPEAAPVTC